MTVACSSNVKVVIECKAGGGVGLLANSCIRDCAIPLAQMPINGMLSSESRRASALNRRLRLLKLYVFGPVLATTRPLTDFCVNLNTIE